MSVLFLIGVFEAIFLILLLAGKKHKTISDVYLGFIFLLYTLTIGGPYLEIYNYRNGFPYPAFLNISWLFLFLHGPALWFYIKSLTATQLNISHSHVNMPCEEVNVRRQMAQKFGLTGLEPLLLIRFGYAKPTPYSFRKNIEKVIV